MPLHRLTTAALTAAVSVTALVSALTPAVAAPMPPRDTTHDSDMGDRLTITVSRTGEALAATTLGLRCHPAGGTHTTAQSACEQLDSQTHWGKDLFAPVSPDAMCTGQYGGPAVAHITGHWAGRPVDAHFSRTDGCQIARWNRFSDVLNTAGS